jgi:hypothetical protein
VVNPVPKYVPKFGGHRVQFTALKRLYLPEEQETHELVFETYCWPSKHVLFGSTPSPIIIVFDVSILLAKAIKTTSQFTQVIKTTDTLTG